MKNWYQIKNLSATTAKISIHQEIGFGGISAAEFIQEIKSLGPVSSIELHIHSPGGSLLDGLAIYNALKNHPATVSGHVDGLAASAASIVLMACDSITMPEDAFLMIHNAQGGAFGDSAELRDMADLMDKLQNSAVDIYQHRTGLDRQVIIDMMAKETWLTANEAKDFGFCDLVLGRIGLAAKAQNFEDKLRRSPLGQPDLSEMNTITDFERFLRDVRCSKKEAAAIVAKAKVIFGQSQQVQDDDALNDRLNHFIRKIPSSLTN